jgi:hypothetical protein
VGLKHVSRLAGSLVVASLALFLSACGESHPGEPDLTKVCLSGSQQYSRGMRLNGLRCLPPKTGPSNESAGTKSILEWRQDEWDDYRDRLGQMQH